MINLIVRKAKKIIAARLSAADTRNDYYFTRIYFKRISKLFTLFNHPGSNCKITDAAISPLGLKFGCHANQIIKEFGQPKYTYNNNNSKHNHKVLFYRRSFNSISLLVQLQFYNNQLYFIGLDVIKRLMEEHEKTEIVNTVIEKYLKTPHMKGDAFPLIQDAHNNLIVINDDINFSICYLWGATDNAMQANIIQSMNHLFTEKIEHNNLFFAF